MDRTRYKSLVYSASVPVVGTGSTIPTTTGNIWWVDSNGISGSGERPDSPFNTFAAAMAKCNANKGDVIVLMPGHAETFTSSITYVAGVYVVALGYGNSRATFTGNAAAVMHALNVANVQLDNIIFAAPGTDDQTSQIAITAAGCGVFRCKFIGSQTAKNITDVITVSAAGHNARIQQNQFENSVVDVVTFISVTGAANDVIISGNIAIGNCSTACLLVSAVATLMKVYNNTFINTKAATISVSFTSNATGVAFENYVGGLNTTLANNSAWGTAMRAFQNFTTEEAGGASGILIPAADTD